LPDVSLITGVLDEELSFATPTTAATAATATADTTSITAATAATATADTTSITPTTAATAATATADTTSITPATAATDTAATSATAMIATTPTSDATIPKDVLEKGDVTETPGRFPNVDREVLCHTIMTVMMTQRHCIIRLTRAGLRLGPRTDRDGNAFIELDLDFADRYSTSH